MKRVLLFGRGLEPEPPLRLGHRDLPEAGIAPSWRGVESSHSSLLL